MQKQVAWLLKISFETFTLVVKIQNWYSGLSNVQKNNVTHNFHKFLLLFGWMSTVIFIRQQYESSILHKEKEIKSFKISIYALQKKELNRVLQENKELKNMEKENQKREIEIAVLKEQLKNKA